MQREEHAIWSWRVYPLIDNHAEDRAEERCSATFARTPKANALCEPLIDTIGPRERSSQQSQGVLQRGILTLVIVLGVEILDFRLRLIQLGLSQLDDGRQAEVISSLR